MALQEFSCRLTYWLKIAFAKNFYNNFVSRIRSSSLVSFAVLSICKYNSDFDYFLNVFEKPYFCGNYILNFRIYPRRILVIKYLCFIRNIITCNIHNYFIKNRNLLIDRAIRNCLFPVERCKCIFDFCILAMLDIPFVRWPIKNFQFKFSKYNQMIRIWG